ncbi:F-box protein RMF [Rhynchospora pubera]|uniref:F-box protein RMF n=1 Tax=Rhynchospora pubera TaxID=906938 RepID=A0AAV8DGL5_9POAL|nr:F-box protein RMF [Rhynchospora pubera]
MAISLLKRLKLFNSNQDGNREREEDNNGEKRRIVKYLKRKLANAKKARETQPTVDWSHLPPDMWTEVAKRMGSKEMGIICSVSRWLNNQFSEGHLWKIAFLRDMKIADDCHVNASWKEIYASAFNGSHSFILHHGYRQLRTDKIRLGAFSLTSHSVLLTHTLSLPNILPPVLIEYSDDILDVCILNNARIGIWISDYHRVLRGPLNNTHIGVAHVLDARHFELFLQEGYNDGTWKYETIAMTMIHSDVVKGGIFNQERMWSPATLRPA